MTGAPIYLVSACTSGEEFVAAFRRYADKNGLFVPIGEPLPLGARARFAVTLKDGGVMIEGEAEITSVSRSPSALHGRVGMMVRFLAPDDASKTLLDELVKARLAMKPAAPSVAPRPAEVPAEPRPVTPAPGGRIDAVNALAECVAIGDVAALSAGASSGPVAGGSGPALPGLPAPKPGAAGGKFVVPSVPSLPRKPSAGIAPVTAQSTGALASVRPIPSRTSTPQSPLAMPPPPAAAEPPSVTPRATPVPDELRQAGDLLPTEAMTPLARPGTTPGAMKPGPAPAAVAKPAPDVGAIDPGPQSDTYIAAVPPAPELLPPRGRVVSTTLTAIPNNQAALHSAPTDIGGPIVDPEPPSDSAIPLATLTRDDASARTQVHAGAPRPSQPSQPAARLDLSDANGDEHTDESGPVDLTQTVSSPPPDMPELRERLERIERERQAARAATAAGTAPAPTPAAAPAPPVVAIAVPRTRTPEIDEPTDLSFGPPQPPRPTPSSQPAQPAIDLEESTAPDGVLTRAPRRTVIGVAVVPGGTRLPAKPTEPQPIKRATAPAAAQPAAVAAAAPADKPAPRTQSSSVRPILTSTLSAQSSANNLAAQPSAILPIESVDDAELDDPSLDHSIDAELEPTGISPVEEVLLDASLDLAADDPAVADAADEPTGSDRIVVSDSASDAAASELTPTLATTAVPPVGPAPAVAAKPAPAGKPALEPAAVAAKPALATATPPAPTKTAMGVMPPSKPPSAASPPVAHAKTPSTAGAPTAAASKTPSGAAAPIAAMPASAAITPAPGIGPNDWIMSPAKLAGLAVAGQSGPGGDASAAPSGSAPTPGSGPTRAKMPTGDWTIALDPQAPDGWSQPATVKPPEEPMPGPPKSTVASADPLDSAPRRPTPLPEELSGEPKVQIDPTLISPLRPMPSDGPLRPMPLDNPFRRVAAQAEPVSSEQMPAVAAVEPPAMPPTRPSMPPGMAPAMAPPSMMTPPPMMAPPMMAPPMMTPPGYGAPQPIASHAPAYPMDPSYQMVPVNSLSAPSPRAATAGGSGVDPRYQSETALPMVRRRRLIIVAITAVVAVTVGAVVLVKLGRHGGDGAPPATAPGAPAPAKPAPAKPAPPSKTSALPQGAMPHADSAATLAAPLPAGTAAITTGAMAAAATAGGAATPTPSPTDAASCFADVASQPAGAEIVVADNVLGLTPHKVALPCDTPVEIVVRKAHLVSGSRTVSPTPDGVPVRIALSKPTFQVKVSSLPAGATIMMNGKPLGVTPTTVKLVGFEAAELSLSKEGYASSTEDVTPRANGIAVHSVLKKLVKKR